MPQINLKKTPYFTVIVPVYNGEKYIKRCVQNILKQTYQDFELIVVNDGSKDRTAEKLAQIKNERLQVVHLAENGGVAAARNRAVELAQGAYILFVDADDRVELSLLEEVYHCIQHSGIDNLKLVVFGVREQYIDHKRRIINERAIIPKEKVTKQIDAVHKTLIALEEQTLYGYLWNKVYNAEYLKSKEYKIPEMRILEDIYFNIDYCQDIDSIAVMQRVLYTYERHDQSATSMPIIDYYEIHRERMRRLYEQYKSWNCLTSKVQSQLAATYTRYLYSAIIRTPKEHRRKFIKQIYEDEVFQTLITKVSVEDCSGAIKMMNHFIREQRTGCVSVTAVVIDIVENYIRALYLKLSK